MVEAIEALRQHFGHASFRPGQEAVVRAVLEGRDVLVVEDVVDTGLTVAALRRTLEAREPRSLRVCALCDKRERRQVDVRVDWVGFTLPNVFVVGYGLDYGGLYRNLPHVVVLERI